MGNKGTDHPKFQAQKWKPGQSGNPKGRPKKKTLEEVVMGVLSERVGDMDKMEALARVFVNQAIVDRDSFIIKELSARLWPIVKELRLDIPSWEQLAAEASAQSDGDYIEIGDVMTYGEPDEDGRSPLNPDEYQAALLKLVNEFIEDGLQPRLTSSFRVPEYNATVGGAAGSKHCVWPSMADDIGFNPGVGVGTSAAQGLERAAREAGLWAVYHDVGSGAHLHIQGLPPGPIHADWLEDWASESTKGWADEVYS